MKELAIKFTQPAFKPGWCDDCQAYGCEYAEDPAWESVGEECLCAAGVQEWAKLPASTRKLWFCITDERPKGSNWWHLTYLTASGYAVVAPISRESTELYLPKVTDKFGETRRLYCWIEI